MRRTSLNCFLILLLLSAMSDDAWAIDAVETDVEDLVVLNNVYLHSPCQNPQKRPRTVAPRCAVRATHLHGLPPAGPARDAAPGRRPDAPSGPDLLHLLMTLRR